MRTQRMWTAIATALMLMGAAEVARAEGTVTIKLSFGYWSDPNDISGLAHVTELQFEISRPAANRREAALLAEAFVARTRRTLETIRSEVETLASANLVSATDDQDETPRPQIVTSLTRAVKRTVRIGVRGLGWTPSFLYDGTEDRIAEYAYASRGNASVRIEASYTDVSSPLATSFLRIDGLD